jgi:hypothetical protein
MYSQTLTNAEITCLLAAWHPVLRQQDPKIGQFRERENLHLARIEGVGTDILVVVKKEL